MGHRYPSLNPEKALIWRATHCNNLPWILENGLHCANSNLQDPGFVPIGNPDLIEKRRQRSVPISPKGTLADYVPFYFTPFSVMMYNVHTGHGVRQRPNAEIVILASSLRHLQQIDVKFVFTDRHAYINFAEFYSDLARLDQLDWKRLQARDFTRDPDDPEKMDRYQAEALIHRHLPPAGLLGIMCYSEELRRDLEAAVHARSLKLPVYARPDWYF